MTPDKALSMTQQNEVVHKQQPVVRGSAQWNEFIVECLIPWPQEMQSLWDMHLAWGDPLQSAQKNPPGVASPRHGKQQCPARASICKKSNNTGHCTSHCFTRSDSHVTVTQEHK